MGQTRSENAGRNSVSLDHAGNCYSGPSRVWMAGAYRALKTNVGRAKGECGRVWINQDVSLEDNESAIDWGRFSTCPRILFLFQGFLLTAYERMRIEAPNDEIRLKKGLILGVSIRHYLFVSDRFADR